MLQEPIFPYHKKQIMEQFGYISFQLILANLDIVGIRIRKNWETVIITYKGGHKTGYMYECGSMTREQQLRVFLDAPEDYNDFPVYEQKFGDRVEILKPPKDNYVFLNDREVAKYVKPKKTKH